MLALSERRKKLAGGARASLIYTVSVLSTDLFDYPLPERLIAQRPTDRRDASRLLVVHRKDRRLEHRHFRDLREYVGAGDTLFRNNAAVIPARLHAARPTGGHVECLLLRPAASNPTPVSGFKLQVSSEWWCLLRPGKKLPVGATFGREGFFNATVLEKTADGLVRVGFDLADGDILEIANRIGEMPLPPYISGHDTDAARALDRERYQTVYADRAHQVAAAAPTAGLHFTPELLAQLAGQGVKFADLTLHVGLGTFRPIATAHIEDHDIHREVYEVPAATQQALFAPGTRRIAVGTTSVRTIEDFLTRHAGPTNATFMGEAGIYIYPPRAFRGVDALITNFHQPRSTLLCLVSAFLAPGSTDGIAWLKEIYAEAVAQDYRFLSYGDAMLIL
jgi:S-adenosylmethionine:tRNA ribosyltransferase-isomerase